jgi:hypothetical protein
MKRSISGILPVVLLLLTAGTPLTVLAVSYPPAPLYHHEYKAEMVMRIGETIYLFQSGTDEIKKAIHVNDTLTVYRISPACEVTTTGKIKILSYVGEMYLKAEVIEGEIKPADIAKKDNISCLVISAGMCNPQPQ